MVGGALGPLVRHPVHRWVWAPALGVGVAAGLGLRLLAEVRAGSVADGIHLVVLVLAMTATVAVVDPAGPIADAAPTPVVERRSVRTGLVLVAATVGWAVALGALPAALRPPVGTTTAHLAVLVSVVLGVAAVEVRLLSRPADPIGASVGVAMAWTALWLLQPTWSPFAPTGDRRWLVVLAGAALLAFSLASSDPARPRWRSRRSGRPRRLTETDGLRSRRSSPSGPGRAGRPGRR